MDKSYRLKMVEKLNNNILTKEYIINCVARFDRKINELAYKERQYRNVPYNNYKIEMDKLIEYRKPYIDALINGWYMTIDDIRQTVLTVKDKNIPTKKVCDQIREIIVLDNYRID